MRPQRELGRKKLEMSEKVSIPKAWWILGTLAIIVVTMIASIPSLMVYHVRLIESFDHMPKFMQEVAQVILLWSTPFSAAVVVAFIVFAVSSKKHADALKMAMVYELLSLGSEIIAALVKTDEFWGQVAQVSFLMVGTGLAYYAVKEALTSSEYFKLLIAQNERFVSIESHTGKVLADVLANPELNTRLGKIADAHVVAHFENQLNQTLEGLARKSGTQPPASATPPSTGAPVPDAAMLQLLAIINEMQKQQGTKTMDASTANPQEPRITK
jgi:hypothetical protein